MNDDADRWFAEVGAQEQLSRLWIDAAKSTAFHGPAMKLDDLIPSKWLKQSDVDGEMLVTVVALANKNVAPDDQPEEIKPCIKFKEFSKPMVMNSTNIKLLAIACGATTVDECKGKQVILYVDPTISYGGKITGGLRIKPAQRAASAHKPAANPGTGFDDMGDDVPF